MSNELIKKVQFKDINVDDPFFDSLKRDYPEFETWFKTKSHLGEDAYIICYSNEKSVMGFLYLKDECEEDSTITPRFEMHRRLKIGTFKVNAHGTSIGQRFVLISLREMVMRGIDCAYVTVLPKHKGLLNVFKKFGFKEWGKKGEEIVLVKNLEKIEGDPYADYPMISLDNEHNNFLLSIYPKYHTDLFPDSKLVTEKNFLYKDKSSTNAIEKIYLTKMSEAEKIKYGDRIIIYRTNDSNGSAWYKSVVTSVCTLVENRNINSFEDLEDFLKYCNKSIFSKEDLCEIYKTKRYPFVLKFLYNYPFKRRTIRGDLITEVGIPSKKYWGCMQLTNEKFAKILEMSLGKDDGFENFIINKP